MHAHTPSDVIIILAWLTHTLNPSSFTPQVYGVPLVGVWLHGVRSIDHPLVHTAALRFRHCSLLVDKALQPDGAFLLLLFTGGEQQTRRNT